MAMSISLFFFLEKKNGIGYLATAVSLSPEKKDNCLSIFQNDFFLFYLKSKAAENKMTRIYL
jgi:hypothetical protein